MFLSRLMQALLCGTLWAALGQHQLTDRLRVSCAQRFFSTVPDVRGTKPGPGWVRFTCCAQAWTSRQSATCEDAREVIGFIRQRRCLAPTHEHLHTLSRLGRSPRFRWCRSEAYASQREPTASPSCRRGPLPRPVAPYQFNISIPNL